MVKLFLAKPVSDDCGDGNAVKERIYLLQRLESILWSVITSEGRYEAHLWLCNTISCIHSITPCGQRDIFVELLRSKQSEKDVAPQLLRMIFEKRPEKVGPIIAKKSYMLEKFFEGNPHRILEWFDNFAGVGESGHKKGARAISQFAFVNRDICWEELEWKGNHGQSPAVVATKPHYFHDLDVLKTVENFIEYVPDFWSSNELAESVKDGNILSIDTKYFEDQFIRLMYKENLEDVWAVIEEFVDEEQFSFLSQHLLILLDEYRLLAFLKSVSKFLHANVYCKEFKYPSCWLENLLSTCSECISLDELLLLNAVITKGRQVVRLMDDEEHEEEKGNVEELLRNASTFSDADHWALMNGCTKMKQQVAMKWVALQSWILHYFLSRECNTRQSCESVFITNGISYRKVDDYALVRSNGFSRGCSSDIDDEDLTSRGHKKRKRDKKKKRRKKHSHDDNSADELVEFETLSGQQGLHSGGGNWLLSTDNYSSAWNTVDLPDHLSKHCFVTWMKLVCYEW